MFNIFVFAVAIYCALTSNYEHPRLQSEIFQHFRKVGLDFIDVRQEWGPLRIGRRADDEPLLVEGKEYKDGVGTHAFSRIRLTPTDRTVEYTLSGICAYPDRLVNEIQCSIRQDGKNIFVSSVLNSSSQKSSFKILLRKGASFNLEIRANSNNINFAHGAWIGLQLLPRNIESGE